ncbi:hypothetical protein BJK06_08205 [Curtobacterium sp. BH-2-1-1]|nr:hypothetical protein BJK06_08205 [Curtobacterium sp. BH-2-1-1]
MIKVVYFDEQSASDYLDITAGGKEVTTSEAVRKRMAATEAKVSAKLVAKLSWLPFLGASADVGAGVSVAQSNQGILSKTLSNTILTDYLEQMVEDDRIEQLDGIRVSAPEGSMAHTKMFTPYLMIMDTKGSGVDLARLDEALATAKGYYEMLGQSVQRTERCVLRFNLQAFRNNYGLTDLARMQLVFHGVLVGTTDEASLSMEAEMSQQSPVPPKLTAEDIIDDAAGDTSVARLKVFDVIFAGVQHGS